MADPIKTMKLYVQVERVFNELRELGMSDSDLLPVETLAPYDQYHYDGVKAVEQAIQQCNITESDHVLDVGAGIGGPARYVAHQTGSRVTAVELQPDLNEIGQHLTKRTALSHLITHQQGDFLEAKPPQKPYDALVSWLAFLHIPDKKRLFKRCFAHLKPNGFLYIEDFSKRHPFTEQEREELVSKVFLPLCSNISRVCGSGSGGWLC